MKRLAHLQGLDHSKSRRRKSQTVWTPLLIAAGLIGVPLAIGLATSDGGSTDENVPQAPTVDANRDYPMNHFLPGAGYYHAPYHMWFPMPFNFFDSNRGYYRGGQWRQDALENETERSEVSRLNSGSFRFNQNGADSFARVTSSRPDPIAVQRANAAAAAHHSANVIRGGFGHSSRPGVS